MVACSSTEAEYIALASAAREAVWLKQILTDLGKQINQPISIHVDNESAIKLAKNPEFHKRTKHIDVRYHYIRDVIKDKTIEVLSISTEKQVADILTKPLLKSRFETLRKNLVAPKQLDTEGNKKKTVKGQKGINSLFLFHACFMIAVCLVGSTHGYMAMTNTPILWKKANTPVSVGYNKVHLMIKFQSPCVILNEDTVHTDILDEAKRKCDELYDIYFTNELQKMCKQGSFTHVEEFHRQKRFIVTATILVITASIVAGVGLGTAGVITGAVALNKIGSLNELIL